MIALRIILEVVLKYVSSSQYFSSEDDRLAVALEVGTFHSLPLNLHSLAGPQFGDDIEGDHSLAKLKEVRVVLLKGTDGWFMVQFFSAVILEQTKNANSANQS